MSEGLAATGLNVGEFDNPVSGVVRHVSKPADVVALMRDPAIRSTIVLTRSGSVTFAGALLPKRPAGLVTIEGAPESHLGILSREFGVPAVMSIMLTDDDTVSRVGPDGLVTSDYIKHVVTLLDGKNVKLDCRDGEVGKVFLDNDAS